MVVVVLIASGAAVCLQLYRAAHHNGAEHAEKILFSVRQQAGVMAALAATVFAILGALTSGKAPATAGPSGFAWGKPASSAVPTQT